LCTARDDSFLQRRRKRLVGRHDIGRQAENWFTPPPTIGQGDGILTLLAPLAPVGCLCLLQFAEWLQLEFFAPRSVGTQTVSLTKLGGDESDQTYSLSLEVTQASEVADFEPPALPRVDDAPASCCSLAGDDIVHPRPRS